MPEPLNIPKNDPLSIPKNDLERALLESARKPELLPKTWRQLRESVLWFLVKTEPDIERVAQYKPGDHVPFMTWENPQMKIIPVFTSLERVQYAMKTIKMVPPIQWWITHMPGAAVLQVCTDLPLKVVINPGCGLQLMLEPQLVRSIADGSILNPALVPLPDARVELVPEAEYPAEFLAPLFRYLSGQSKVTAAWLFRTIKAKPTDQIMYLITLLPSSEYRPDRGSADER